MSRPSDPVQVFLGEVRRIRRSGHGTAEQSYYPAVNTLLTDLGELGLPVRRVLAHPAAVLGNLPDVALCGLSHFSVT